MIKSTDGCPNNAEKSSTAKTGKHIPPGYSMSTILAFHHTENKRSLYRGDDVRRNAKNVIHSEKNVFLSKKKLK